jgi:glycosyltransferase involved in cell wall biosynthesis
MDINLLAPINSLGYGIASLNIFKALKRKRHDIALFIIGNQSEAPESDIEDIQEACSNCQLYSPEAPSIRIWHQHDLAYHIGKGLHCGFPIFELNRFTQVELHQMRAMDVLLVCSKWAKHIIEANGLTNKIVVAPLGVDRNIFHEKLYFNRSDNTTVFFNCGKWEIRKGHDILTNAFNQAFEPNDNVKLVLNCSNPFLSELDHQTWINKYLKTKMGQEGKIIIYNKRCDNQSVLANLMMQTDCGVFPARAEGWNLELLEMMALGKHVIATNYSGHSEFINNDNCKLIEINGLEPAEDKIWFHKQGDWAKIGAEQIDQLIHHMKDVHKDKQEGKLGINQAGINTSLAYNWNNTADCIIKGVS